MFSTLPDFTPRDTHSLWYSSSQNPSIPVGVFDGLPPDHATGNHGQSSQSRHRSGQVLERTALARLAADETYMQRRRLNVQNFGSGWLRPPGIAKTLHQMREEKREQEEHQEAMRRERLAQELAEAEADAAAEAMDDEQGMMDDVQLDGAQDLDEDIPDADDDFALGGDSDEEEPEDDEEEEPQPDSEDDESRREDRQNDLMAARMQMADDAFRQALVRGETDGDDMYGGEEELEEEDQGHMLGEDDFADSGNYVEDGYDDLGMDGDLDDDIPEAESGMYEHTDSEAELSSSEAPPASEDGDGAVDEEDIGFAPRTAPLGPPQSPTLGVRSRRSTNASAGRASMDLSALLSQDESSFMDSSPVQRRRQ